MNILYDENPDKNLDEFRKALIERVKQNMINGKDDFSGIVFPCDIAWVDKIILRGDAVVKYLPNGCTQIGNEITVEHGFLLGNEVEFLKWNKKVKEFKEANFSDVQFSGEAYFSCVQFSGGAYFRDAKFKVAYFGNAQFSGLADFVNAQFSGLAYFSDAQFSGEANFWNAKFSGGVNFWNVKFSGLAYFRSARFSGLADFRGARFSGEANFSDVQFSGEANFRGARFSGEAYFSCVQFSGLAYFSDAQFSGLADFRDVRFSGLADFRDAKFKVANFIDAKFSGEANFIDAQFSGLAYFRSARFSGLADFRGARFSGEANFSDVQFSGEANFRGARFSGEAYFSDVQFSGEANFRGARFSGEAYFSCVQFSGLAYFSDAQFSGLAYFWNAKFSGEANFGKAKLLGDKIYFLNIETSAQTSFDFSQCTFGDDALDLILFEDISEGVPMKFERLVIGSDHIKFNKVNLTQATFAHTDLRRFEFTDITWGSIKEKGFTRKIIQDEKSGKTEAVERLYRQLKQSYEDNREYVLAGEFHFSEKSLQQHRAYQNKNYGQWFWLATYRWLSGYGERLLPSASWLLLLTFFVMPLVYLGTGIRLKDKDAVSDFYILEWDRWRETEELTETRKENGAKPNTVLADAACLPYALKKDSFNVHWYPHRCQYDEKRNILRSIGYWQGEWDAYGKAFGHSFKVILPFQERMHVSYSFLGALATGIHTILAPLLFFLFSAALRQRTRR